VVIPCDEGVTLSFEAPRIIRHPEPRMRDVDHGQIETAPRLCANDGFEALGGGVGLHSWFLDERPAMGGVAGGLAPQSWG
jgi:hypothetical protein